MILAIGLETFFNLGIIVIVAFFGNVDHQHFATWRPKGAKLGTRVTTLIQVGTDIRKPGMLCYVGVHKYITNVPRFTHLSDAYGLPDERGRPQYTIEFLIHHEFALLNKGFPIIQVKQKSLDPDAILPDFSLSSLATS